jgi:hypothetical protein
MSRGLDIDRDDDRSRDEGARRVRELREAHVLLRHDDERDPDRRSESLPSRDFALPDGRERETVHLRAWGFRLRDTESQTPVAAGSFRVVFGRDLREGPYRGDTERLAQDVKALRAQGLIGRRTIAIDEQGHSVGVLALTERGRALLEARSDREQEDGPAQAVYAGWHKPAEVVHDASIYRTFERWKLDGEALIARYAACPEGVAVAHVELVVHHIAHRYDCFGTLVAESLRAFFAPRSHRSRPRGDPGPYPGDHRVRAGRSHPPCWAPEKMVRTARPGSCRRRFSLLISRKPTC